MGSSELNYRIAELEEIQIERPVIYVNQFCRVLNPIENFQPRFRSFVQDFSDEEADLANNSLHFRTFNNLKWLLDMSYVIAQTFYERKIPKPIILVPISTLRSYVDRVNGITLNELKNKELRDPASFYIRFFEDNDLRQWHWNLQNMLESACTNLPYAKYAYDEDEALKFTNLLKAVVQMTYYVSATNETSFAEKLRSSIAIDPKFEIR